MRRALFFLTVASLAVAFASLAVAQPPAEPVGTAPDYVSLSGAERWQRAGQQTFLSPALYFASFGSAAGQQLHNDPPEWRQGLKGYARRSASQFGAFTLQIGIREASAAALHYEPRYIRSGREGFLPRAGHAIAWSFVTWDTDRHVRFNVPAVAAAYGSGMISTAWYPARYSAFHDGVRNGNRQMGVAVGVNVLREFAPELKRFFHLKP
jgi:hypothetical protein